MKGYFKNIIISIILTSFLIHNAYSNSELNKEKILDHFVKLNRRVLALEKSQKDDKREIESLKSSLEEKQDQINELLETSRVTKTELQNATSVLQTNIDTRATKMQLQDTKSVLQTNIGTMATKIELQDAKSATQMELKNTRSALQTSIAARATKTELRKTKSALQINIDIKATKTELQDAKSTLQNSIGTRPTKRELQSAKTELQNSIRKLEKKFKKEVHETTVTITLKNDVLSEQGSKAGVYELTDEEVNGKPTYRKDKHGIWYNDLGNWMIGEIGDLGSRKHAYIHTVKNDFEGIIDPRNVWKYYNGDEWKTAGTNDVNVEFNAHGSLKNLEEKVKKELHGTTLTLTLKNDVLSELGSKAGVYELRDAEVNGKPSYKKDNNGIWYNDKGQWTIGKIGELGSDKGFIFNVENKFEGIIDPRNVWKYFSDNEWKTAGTNDVNVEFNVHGSLEHLLKRLTT